MQGRKKIGFGCFLSVLGDTPRSTPMDPAQFSFQQLQQSSLATMQDSWWYVRENKKSYPMGERWKKVSLLPLLGVLRVTNF